MLVWEVPHPIEIRSRHSSSIITGHHSLVIHHWHEEYCVKNLQLIGLFIVQFQELDYSLENIGSWGFSWMLSCHDENCVFLSFLYFLVVELVHIELLIEWNFLVIELGLVKENVELSESVGVALSEVTHVVLCIM